MDLGLDFPFQRKWVGFGFGFGFMVMGWGGFGAKIIAREEL